MFPQTAPKHTSLKLIRCARICLGALVLFIGVIAILSLLSSTPAVVVAQIDSRTATFPPSPNTDPLTSTLTNPSFECTAGFITQTTGTTSTAIITTALGLTDTLIVSDAIAIPRGWTMVPISGTPIISSTQLFFSGDCVGNNQFERLDGIDSLVIRSEDIETPPLPGKPFDVAFYQQILARPDTAYSLSGWLLSLCGGSAVPSDCPDGVYMAKMLGLDPTGGIDPLAETVVWAENRANFVSPTNERIGWQNLQVSVRSSGAITTNTLVGAGLAPARREQPQGFAPTSIPPTHPVTLTVFARVHSPFRHHGNHAFVDAIRIARSPVVTFTHEAITHTVGITSGLFSSVTITGPVTITDAVNSLAIISGTQAALRWRSELGEDIESIEGGRYWTLVDVQVRAADVATWTDVVSGYPANGCVEIVPAEVVLPERDRLYFVRGRARAEQYAAGVFPEQRYVGVWGDPLAFYFVGSEEMAGRETVGGKTADGGACPPLIYLPLVERAVGVRY